MLPPQPLEIVGLTFSPDGDFIYFVRSKKTLGFRFYLYRIPVLGGNEEMILENIDTRVSFSPDGHQFAFMRGQPPTNLEIHVANSDGSNDRSIASLKAFLDPRFINGVSWSPDGKTIVVPTLHGPKDEKFLLIGLSPEGIQHELLNLGDFIGVPAWAPNAKSMMLPTQKDVRNDVEGSTGTQIWSLSFPEGKLNRITHDLTNYGPILDITKDGQNLVAVERRKTSHVWAVPDGDSNRAKPLTTGNISYDGVRPGPRGGLLLRRESGQMETLKPGHLPAPFLPNISNFLSFTACSDKYVIFNNHMPRGIELWRTDPDGSNALKLVDNAIMGECSPDGTWVLYSSENVLYRLSVDGGSPTQLVLPGNVGVDWATVSPNGQSIAYMYPDHDPQVAAWRIAVIPATGGKLSQVYNAPGEAFDLEWSPDGKGLQYLRTWRGVTNLWEQKLAGGEPKPITHFTEGLIFDFCWTRDGHTLTILRGDINQDVLMIRPAR